MSKKKVITIIPSPIISRGIEAILRDIAEVDYMGTFTHLPPIETKRFSNINPELVILDPIILDFHSRTVARSILSEYFDCPILALNSVFSSDSNLRQYDGYIDIYDDIKVVQTTITDSLNLKKESSKGAGNELTLREKEILICVAKGMLNKQIAEKFKISIYTVISHRKNIMRKTCLDTVPALTAYAIIQDLIDINSVG